LLLHWIFDRWLGFLTVETAREWPWIVRVVFTLLLGDFLFYISHFVRHHVTPLWYFHAVHHSQKELNFFTEYRVHPIDDVGLFTIGFVPFFMFEHSFATIVAVVWLRHWHTRIYHSNIRSNFGPLRYVLVTPQSHRVHHSMEPRHFDTNFGLTFSIWDHLFGTQYRGYDEYPDTGIDDKTYPYEQSGDSLLSSLMEQLIYPFSSIARDLGAGQEAKPEG
jgi:sterol desaturase/sphingolipid hydroxylase (fatty acid hydroxylase superfamily)